MSTLRSTYQNIRENATDYNKAVKRPFSLTLQCIVTKVNTEEFTVDVFVPSATTSYYDVAIGNSLISRTASLKVLPTIGQRGIVLVSTQHSPVLISTMPNTVKQKNNALLEGESKLGTNECFLKTSKDNSATLKTCETSLVISDEYSSLITNSLKIYNNGMEKFQGINESTKNFYSTETIFNVSNNNYAIAKAKVGETLDTQIETKKKVIEDNNALLDKLNNLITSIEDFNDNIELGDISSIDKFTNFKKKISEDYSGELKTKVINVEKGDTVNNVKNNRDIFIEMRDSDFPKASISVNKDGTIIVSCKDFIINKKGV